MKSMESIEQSPSNIGIVISYQEVYSSEPNRPVEARSDLGADMSLAW